MHRTEILIAYSVSEKATVRFCKIPSEILGGHYSGNTVCFDARALSTAFECFYNFTGIYNGTGTHMPIYRHVAAVFIGNASTNLFGLFFHFSGELHIVKTK